MNQDYHISLLVKQLQDDLSPDELKKLNLWLESDPKNQHLAADFVEVWQQSSGFDPLKNEDLDLDEEFESLQSKMNTKKQSDHTPYLRWLLPIAASLMLLAGWFAFFQKEAGIPSQNLVLVKTDVSTKSINLPDGTKVTLGPETEIKYSASFLEERKVEIDGSAFFDVKKREGSSFEINGAHSGVEVLGTTFIYEDDSKALGSSLQLFTGKLRFTNKANNNSWSLTEGESIQITSGSDGQLTKSISLKNHEWYAHEFSFNQAKLSDVIHEVSTFFGSPITLDKQLSTCLFSGNLPAQNIDDTLGLLTSVYGSTYTIQNNSYVVSEGSCR